MENDYPFVYRAILVPGDVLKRYFIVAMRSTLGYRLGGDRGSPKVGSTLLSNWALVEIRSPRTVRTCRPVPWWMPVRGRGGPERGLTVGSRRHEIELRPAPNRLAPKRATTSGPWYSKGIGGDRLNSLPKRRVSSAPQHPDWNNTTATSPCSPTARPTCLTGPRPSGGTACPA